jgi:large repetitive protein
VAPTAPGTPALLNDPTNSVISDTHVAGDNITSVQAPTFTGTAEKGATVKLYQSGSATVIGTGVADQNGVWKITPTSNLTVGSNNIIARQTDSAGNESAASGALAVTVDTRADGQIRYLTLARSSWSGVFQNIQEISVYTDDGQKLNLAQLGASALSSAGSATGLIDGLLGNTYIGNPGSFVWARIDLKGFYRVSQVDVVVASDNPDRSNDYKIFGSIGDTVTGTSLNYSASNLPETDSQLKYLGVVNATTPGQTVVFKQGIQARLGELSITPMQSVAGQPTLTGTGEAGATVEITNTVDDFSTVLGTAKVNSAGVWSFLASTITSGTHNITVKQTDLAGNTHTLSSGYSFTVDANQMGLPALASASDSGAKGDTITNVAAPTLAGSGVGATALVEIFDGITKLGETTAVNGSWTFTPQTLSAGLHNITARSGGVTSSIFSLTIDTAAAAPSITTPVASNVQRAPTLSGTGAEANASIILSARAIDGSASQSFTATANASGAWAIDTANPPNPQTALAANKVWVFSATQTDAAGNVSALSAPQTVNFDTSIATPLTISNLADNASTNRQVTLSGTAEASNALGNVTVKVYDGSTVLGTTTTDFMGGWTFTTPALSAGAHTLKVEQLDAAGNLSAQLSKPITVDTTALGAPVLGGYDGLQISTVANGSNRLVASNVSINAANGSAVSFWARLDSSPGGVLSQLVGDTLGNYDLWVTGGSLILWSNGDVSVGGYAVDTNWHQYVLSQDGLGNIQVFVDGVLRLTTGGRNTTFTSDTFIFGGLGTTRGINGAMRDINVWDVSLSTPQVQALYQGQATGQESQIKAAYALLGDTTATTGPALTVNGTMTGVVSVNGRVADTGILGDNITSVTSPVLRGQAAANATLEVWDTVGGVSSFVKRVVADGTGAWSTTLSNQTQGVHNYVARQLNTNGTTTDSAATTLTIDTIAPSAPSAAVLAVASNSGLTNDTITNINTPTLSGTAEGNAWVSVFQAGNLVGKVKALANGSWTFTVPRALADGSYSFTAKQEDTAGNLSAASSALSVTVDSTVAAPVVAVVGQVRYILLKQTGVSQNMFVNEVEVYSNNSNVALGITATAGNYPVFNGYPVTGVTNGSLVRDGGNAYASSAVSTDNWIQIDLGGLYSIEQVKVFALSSLATDVSLTSNIDIFGSASALSSFTYAQLTAGKGGAIKVGGTGASAVYTTTLSTPAWQTGSTTQPLLTGQGEAGATVEITDTVNGTPTVLATVKVNSTGVWSYQATTITSGNHSITYKQTDVAGNVSALSNPYVFNITVAPVVIDLNRDGVLSYSQAVIDVNRDGQLDHSAWVAPQDGVLVWDKFHDGQVRDASQYVFSQGQGQTDLQGLAAQFDTNRDGVFNAQDAKFTEFAVWQDRNQNGVSDAGEVRSLADVGLTAIRLQSDGVARQTAPGVHEAGRSSATASDGSSVLLGDVGFAFTSLTSVAATSAKQGQINLATDTSANLLQLRLQDLLALPEQNLFNTSNTQAISGTPLAAGARQLMITGDKTDVVKLDANTWSASNTVVAHAGHHYQVYTANTSHAQLLIDQTIVNAGHVL